MKKLVKSCFLLGVFCLSQLDIASNEIEKPFFIVGPGFNSPNLIFPNRYFFVFYKTPLISLKILATENQSANDCRLWTQVFTETQFCVHLNQSKLHTYSTLSDLLDSSPFCDTETKSKTPDGFTFYLFTIVRYKLFGQNKCSTPLEIQITFENQQVVYKQPFNTDNENTLFSDHCHCASSAWRNNLRCDDSRSNQRLSQQINADLEPFKNGINFDSVLNESIARFAKHTRTYSFCLYQIISNELYRNCFGEYVGFARFYDEMLLSLLQKTTVQDVEFVANLGDWPLSSKSKSALPMFSWCGSEDSYDIVLPTYELTESILHSQGRITTDILSTFGKQSMPYTQKENKLFWRGRDSHRARLKLIKLAQNDPSKFNVSITNFFFFRDEMHEYTNDASASSATANETRKTKSSYVPFFDFFNYRFQLNIDGTVAAYRFPFLLAGNSLVIKQKSQYYEFFYKQLQSGIHYLSTRADLSDLTEQLSMLINNNSSETTQNIKTIIWTARKFVLSHLLPENVYCYYYNAISKYTQLLTTPVKLRPNVELVTLDEDSQPMIVDKHKEKCICNPENLQKNHHDEL